MWVKKENKEGHKEGEENVEGDYRSSGNLVPIVTGNIGLIGTRERQGE